MTKPAGWRQRLAYRLLGVGSPGTDLAVKEAEQKSLTTGMSLPIWLDGQPHYSDWTVHKAINDGYKASGMLYACVEIISDAAASVPLIAYRRDRDLQWAPSQDEPIQALIDQPNPFMTRQVMIKRIAQHMLLGGNALWTKMRFKSGPMKGLPFEMWPLAPDGVKPVVSRTEFIENYRWFANGLEEFIDVRDIMHFMQIDPSQPYWGIGSMQALFKAVETDKAAQDFQKVGMANRGVVSGIMSFKMPLSAEQYAKARTIVNEGISGAENARRVLVMGSDATYTSMGMTPEEMDFIETRKMTREEIMQGMRVPPPMVGVYDQATLANIETSRQIFWLDRMMPFLSGIQEVFNQSITPEFDSTGDLWLGFDTTNVDALQQNIDERVDVYEKLVKNRVKPMAAARIAGIDLTEEDIEEKQAPPQFGPPKPPGADPDEEDDEDEKRRGVGRSVKQSLPKAVGVRAFDRWSDEQKNRYWQDLEDDRVAWEERLARKTAEVFTAEGERVASLVESGAATDEVLAKGVDEKAWTNMLSSYYRAGMEHFVVIAYSRDWKSGRRPGEAKKFFRLPVSLWEWAQGRIAEKVTYITETTRMQLKIQLTSAESQTIDQVARNIRQVYQHWGTPDDSKIDTHRAYVIARTEMGAIANKSNQVGTAAMAKELGVVMVKTWLSSRDARVRESHASLDGETRPMDEPYSNGLMFPNDPEGAASEVIQCRCVEMYDEAGEAEITPVPEPGKDSFAPPGWDAEQTDFQPPDDLDEAKELLTNDPIQAQFLTEEEKYALRSYAGGGGMGTDHPDGDPSYAEMNDALRDVDFAEQNRLKHVIDPLRRLTTERTLPSDMRLYRGVALDVNMDGDPQKLVGTLINDDGFVSTSLRPEHAIQFSPMDQGDSVIVEIQAQKGTMGFYVDAHHDAWDGFNRDSVEQWDEQEVILPPGQQFRITKVERRTMRNDQRLIDQGQPEMVDYNHVTVEIVSSGFMTSKPIDEHGNFLRDDEGNILMSEAELMQSQGIFSLTQANSPDQIEPPQPEPQPEIVMEPPPGKDPLPQWEPTYAVTPGSDEVDEQRALDDLDDWFSEPFLGETWTDDEIAAIGSYTSDEYTWIQMALRGQTADMADAGMGSGEIDLFVNMAGDLETALTKEEAKLPFDTVFWRGYSMRPGLPDDLSKLIGTVLGEGDHAVTSTSVSRRKAQGFIQDVDRGVLLKVRARTGDSGLFIGGISHMPGEQEWLFAPGTRFRVVSVEEQARLVPGSDDRAWYPEITVDVLPP